MEASSCFHNLREGGIVRQLAPGIAARIFPGVNVMLSVVTNEPHSVSPMHSHPHEQWGVCLEREWIRIRDGEEHPVRAGDFWQTPPNVPHGGRTLDQRCVVLDIFSPPREEYRQTRQGFGTASLVP
jgi:quercetin dioxygenase-like cupin family protein